MSIPRAASLSHAGMVSVFPSVFIIPLIVVLYYEIRMKSTHTRDTLT